MNLLIQLKRSFPSVGALSRTTPHCQGTLSTRTIISNEIIKLLMRQTEGKSELKLTKQ